MRIEVVHHERDLLGLRILHIDQITNKFCPICFGPPFAHREDTRACQRLAGHKQATCPVPLILTIFPLHLTSDGAAHKSAHTVSLRRDPRSQAVPAMLPTCLPPAKSG